MYDPTGGSDVAGGTETLAVQDPNSKNMYKLYGYKFFSSATDADIALSLARVVDPATGKITSVNNSKLGLNFVMWNSSILMVLFLLRVQKDCPCF